MKKIIKSIAALLLFTSLQTQAVELLDLSGDYIRIGVSDYGTIGSKGNTSPGILYDNTGTGTFNTGYDYLTPGSPFEGWTVAYNGTASVTNNNTGIQGITGGVLTDYSGVAYNGTTFDNRAVWTGSHVDFDLLHDVKFNNNQKFIDIESVLTAKTAMTDLYFGRFTDPDARAAAGDSSRTTNTLGFDPIPTTQVVFSEALVSKYALGLYSAASNVGAGISAGWSTDPTTYYTGTNNGDGDYTIGLGFHVPTVAIGDVVTFKYAYIFGPSTLAAGTTAVVSGAGGGTPGEVPGCVTDCTLPPDPSAGPTLVSTETETASVTVVHRGTTTTTTDIDYARAEAAKALNITKTTTVVDTTPVTTTVSTTPVTVETYSDSSVVRTPGTAVVVATTVNDVDTDITNNYYATRTDQYAVLRNSNDVFNQQLLSTAADRRITGATGAYLNLDGQRTSTKDTYKQNAVRVGVGYDREITDKLTVGFTGNIINANLRGDAAGGDLDKGQLGAYASYDYKNWLLVGDAGASWNRYKTRHSLPELGLSNKSSASGYDVWVSGRAYAPSLKGFRPYAGAQVNYNYIEAVTESGDALTAMAYDKVSTSKLVGLYGVRYDYAAGRVNLAAEIGSTTDNLRHAKIGATFAPKTNIVGGIELMQQRYEGWDNNVVSANIKYLF